MYSSITNADYADFYYNAMHNPIGVNNRVALTPGSNPCFSYFMGTRYVITGKNEVPDGYDTIMANGNYVIAENPDVLPVCYGTTNIMTESTYEQLQFPENMVALCQNVVVKGIGRTSNQRESDAHRKAKQAVKKRNVSNLFTERSLKALKKIGQNGSTTLEFNNSVRSRFLVLSFDIERNNGRSVFIDIHGVTNKLSADDAPYPNGNDHFVYVLPIKDGTKQLKGKAGKGYYQIKNISAYLVDKSAIANSSVVMPSNVKQKEDGSTIFDGTITMNKRGYFVTSYPYRDGYHIEVDGKAVYAKKVNQTFVGVPLSSGEHTITVKYVAPGYYMGLTISVVSIILFSVWLLYEQGYQWVQKNKMQEIKD